MFTGIIEGLGELIRVEKEDLNVHFTLSASFVEELRVDQSVAHDGVCLTVVECTKESYTVTAIQETLLRTNLSSWAVGERVNLERCTKVGDRLDGHIVQGHVDQTGVCSALKEEDGSWVFTFTYDPGKNNVTIEKGSITIDGTSLTVINSEKNSFSVAIIPYTYAHTCFQQYQVGTVVNLEFDVIGKYVKRLLELGK